VAAGGRDSPPLGRGGQPVRPLVAVIGGSTCTSEEAEWAGVVGRLLAEQEAVLLCGGLGGVMEAGSDRADANPFIDVPLATGMGEMRNALIVRAAQAVIAIGGGWGTLSEIALAQRIGTPIVGLHDAFPSVVDMPRVTTPEQAVRWALEQAREGQV